LNLSLPGEALSALLEEVRHFAVFRKGAVTDEELRALVADFKMSRELSGL
jgi:hypothetical protein